MGQVNPFMCVCVLWLFDRETSRKQSVLELPIWKQMPFFLVVLHVAMDNSTKL